MNDSGGFPEDLIRAASVDELNFLAAQLQKLDAVELAELNAAMQSPALAHLIGQELPLTPTGWEVLSQARNREPLPITAISCEPATNGSVSMRASQCRDNTG